MVCCNVSWYLSDMITYTLHLAVKPLAYGNRGTRLSERQLTPGPPSRIGCASNHVEQTSLNHW